MHASKSPLLVLADDLTGAAEVSAVLAGPEPGLLCLDLPEVSLLQSERVIGVDLDTRSASEFAARGTIAAAVAHCADWRGEWFKKIDSTLRGHLGPELTAYLSAHAAYSTRSRPLCIVAPAHPALGRTLIGAQLQIEGKPRSQSGYWSGTQAAEIILDELLRRDVSICTRLDLQQQRTSDTVEIARWLEQQSCNQDIPVVVCDSENANDLQRLVTAVRMTSRHPLWVGSGGLAEAISSVDTGETPYIDSPEPDRANANRDCRPQLFVVGSYSSVATRQLEQLADEGVEECKVFLDPATSALSAQSHARLRRLLSGECSIAISVEQTGEVRVEQYAHYARAMARAAVDAIDRFGSVICCGGDTTRALLETLGVRSCDVLTTHARGVTAARLQSKPEHTFLIKAGAFGSDDLLQKIHRHLQDYGDLS